MDKLHVTFDGNQKAAIVALLLDMVNADGKVTFEELVCTNHMLRCLGVTEEDFLLGRDRLKDDYALHIALNMTDEQKIVLGKLLVEVIDADGKVDPSELHLLKSFALKTGLEPFLLKDRIKGCMFGQAIGDALGLGTEFLTKTEVARRYPGGLTDYSQIYQDAHTSRWHKGDWTDDTDMWLCIARAVISSRGEVDIAGIAHNFKEWFNGEPLGIGNTTNKVLCMRDYESIPFQAAELWWNLSGKKSAANGGLMRTSVIGLLPNYSAKDAEDVCRMTHADPRCIGSCVIVCDLIHALIYEDDTPSLESLCMIADSYDSRIAGFVRKAHDGLLTDVCLDDASMGYTLHTLFAALWAYWHAASFEEGLLAVVNAGGDADTNAAVACSLLGAKFGFDAIPSKYVNGLYRRDEMEHVFQSLAALFFP